MRTLKRRRSEYKTDYQTRIEMLKSNIPRVAFRKTNKYIIGQFIESFEAKDKVKAGVISKDLLGYSWPKSAENSLKSMAASYLTGFLLGKKILDTSKDNRAIFDIGMLRNIKKSKIYSFLKGVIDAGVNINASKDIFPDEKRIEGENMKNKIDFKKIKDNINKKFK